MRRLLRRSTTLVTALAVVVAGCSGDAAPVATTATTAVTTTAPPATVTTTSTTIAEPTTTTTTTEPEPGLENRTLATQGDTNETVEAAQFLINCYGIADLTVDGAFGPATRAAVEAAQASIGQTADGVIDEELVRALSRFCAERRRLTGGGDLTVVGNTTPEDPEVYTVALLGGSTLGVTVADGDGVLLALTGADGSEVVQLEDGTWEVESSQDYLLTVTSEEIPVTFTLTVTLAAGGGGGGWILATNGISYGDTKLSLGDDAQTVIDKVVDFLGHGVRGSYAEFDTGWYAVTEPSDMGLRGVFIEGLAFLFYGPDPNNLGRPETLQRIRFEGPSDDASGEPRPANYVTTAEGVTVGHNLAHLESAYGDRVKPGSNSEEHYWRFADSGGELCFYFGTSAPTDGSVIIEIATQCRS
jgi:peptidoglycan hydrolase-like protein with peptidoglycan-binding domain